MIYGTVCGRVTKDAEVRYVASGEAVLGFTVAADIGYGDKKHAVFTKCSLWGKRGEAVAAYVTKGAPVTVIGAMDLREWESNGKTGKDLELKVSELILQGGKNTQSGNDHAQSGNATPKQQGFRQEQPSQSDFDDDIPF